MKKLLTITVAALLLLATVGCKNQDLHNSNVQNQSQELYDNIDLSQYASYGSFSDDGVMWVEKSDYTGKSYGCINTEGEYVIPLTSTIKEIPGFAFKNGFCVVIFKSSKRIDNENGVEYEDEFGGIYNSKGELVNRFEIEGSSWNYLNNGNIFFSDIDPYGTLSHTSSNAYMFCAETSELIEMPIPAWQGASSLEYSDGLMLIYSRYYRNPGAKYYDEKGKCIIDLDNSNEYYKQVMYATDFTDGQASVNFIGMDDNWYNVKIDKTGKWINEPIQISEYDAETFS